MTPALQSPARLTLEQFLDYDDGTERIFELIDGLPIPMPEPSSWHENIIEQLKLVLRRKIQQLDYGWEVKTRRLIEIPVGGLATARRPDLMIVNREELKSENRVLYEKPHLIIEIASHNWGDDLQRKIYDYSALRVPEYWVVDYKGLIPAKYCDRGKGVKTIVFNLEITPIEYSIVKVEYQRKEYLADEMIECTTFPDLQLTTHQIVNCL